MNINRKLNLDSVLALALLLVVTFGCTRTRRSEPSANSGGSNSNESAASNELTAEALFDEYEKDRDAADKKYKDKLLVVTGTVDLAKTGASGNPYVTMNTSNLVLRVQFLFDKSDVDAVSQLRKGQKATIKGRVFGKLVNVVLKDCELL